MSGKAPARIQSDLADSVLLTGSLDVLIDFNGIAFEGSITASGNAVVTSSRSVLVNGRGIARESDLTASGAAIRTGFQDICVGD